MVEYRRNTRIKSTSIIGIPVCNYPYQVSLAVDRRKLGDTWLRWHISNSTVAWVTEFLTAQARLERHVSSSSCPTPRLFAGVRLRGLSILPICYSIFLLKSLVNISTEDIIIIIIICVVSERMMASQKDFTIHTHTTVCLWPPVADNKQEVTAHRSKKYH